MTRKDWLLFAAISICWDIPYLFIKAAVRQLDPTVAAGSDLCPLVVALPIRLCTRCRQAGRYAAPRPRHRDARSASEKKRSWNGGAMIGGRADRLVQVKVRRGLVCCRHGGWWVRRRGL
jgi:hypothetical protein